MSAILESAVLLRLSFEKFGNVRKADKKQIQTDADKDRLKLGKVLFDCEEYNAIGTFDGKLREWVTARAIAVDVGFPGVYILPLALLQDVEAKMTAAKVERAALVGSFLGVYDSEREKARVRLNGQFQESDYPAADVVRSRFGLSWRYVTFDVPDKLPPEVLERERQAREESFAAMENEVRLALREGLADLAGHLVERLADSPAGEKKIFRNSAVENLVEFLDLFNARDVTKDSELQALVSKARDVIKFADPERLRKSSSIRAEVREKLAGVKVAVDSLVDVQRRRKFTFD